MQAQRLLWTSPSFFETAEFEFYSGLAHAALCAGAVPEQYRHDFEALTAHRRKLEVWAAHCPENFESRAALVGAEVARIEGREVEAMRLYEQAVRSARANGFLHIEALANELAARFYAARGFEQIAQLYVRNARQGYQRWGADGKVRQLDGTYPYLQEGRERVSTASGTIGAPVDHLDLATVLKVSQAVSGEIVLEKLIETLLRTAIEHAGAQRGVLILPRGGELLIQAEATTRGSSITVRLREIPVSVLEVPESVVRYAARSQETVILDDASTWNPFSTDPYIREQRPRSVLCLPLVKQGVLVAVLYMENNLGPNFFAPGRIAVLKVLASQAAIALDNSRLYRDLAQREQALRQSEAYLAESQRLTHTGSWTFDQSAGKVVYWSDEMFRIYGRDPRREGLPTYDELLRYVHPDDRDGFNQASVRGRDKTEMTVDYRIVMNDGTVRHVHSTRLPVLDKSGALVEIVGTLVDVTERRQAEQRLQLRVSMLQHIPVAAWSVMPDGTPDIVNELWFEYTGQTPEYVNSSPEAWMSTVHPEDRERASGIYWDGIRTGQGFTMEARFLRARDGAYRWHLNRAVAVRDSEGNILRFVGTSTDVHDWRQAQEELRNTQAELAHTTRVLTMGELTASIAHEVNQPLGAIVASAGACERWLAATPPQMEKARRALERIVNDGRRAGRGHQADPGSHETPGAAKGVAGDQRSDP